MERLILPINQSPEESLQAVHCTRKKLPKIPSEVIQITVKPTRSLLYGSVLLFLFGLQTVKFSSTRDLIGIQKMKLNSIPAPVSAHNSNPEELQTTLLSRATSLSETALRVLLCKRDKLTLDQRFIEDEIAKCDERIKNIKGDMELQLETILESCNEAYPSRNLQESAWQSNKRVKFCEPQTSTKSMCQRLDDICIENNWVLPNYRVSLSDGGFEAEVRIYEEAKESAAACMLTTLHHNTPTANYLVTEDSLRTPSSVKLPKLSTSGETPSKDPLTSEMQTSIPLPTEDLSLSHNMYTALRELRMLLVKECPDGVMAYHKIRNQ